MPEGWADEGDEEAPGLPEDQGWNDDE